MRFAIVECLYWLRGPGLCQGRCPWRSAGHHRATADLFNRAYAGRAIPLGLARPGLSVLRRNADGGSCSRGQLFLEGHSTNRGRLDRGRSSKAQDSREFRLALGIVIATIPIVIAGAAAAHFLNACATPARALIVIAVACLVMSALLACPEILAVHTRTISDLKLRDALIVGIAQVGALIPGVSRSGSTLTAALCLDLKRDEAAGFLSCSDCRPSRWPD